MTSLDLSLTERTEELQGALEKLEELYKDDKARLEEQLTALTVDKVLSVINSRQTPAA